MTCHWFILMALFLCQLWCKDGFRKQENQINVNKSCSSCGCSNVAAQDFSVASEPRVNKTQWVSYYHIPRMDCAAEEQMVRMALASYAEHIQELHFDLPARHLAVYHSTQDEKITQCLQRLGLGAELQQTQPHYEPVEKPKRFELVLQPMQHKTSFTMVVTH